MAHYWYALLERRALLLAKPGTRRLVGLKLAAEMVRRHLNLNPNTNPTPTSTPTPYP